MLERRHVAPGAAVMVRFAIWEATSRHLGRLGVDRIRLPRSLTTESGAPT